jgi:hypothetical protein
MFSADFEEALLISITPVLLVVFCFFILRIFLEAWRVFCNSLDLDLDLDTLVLAINYVEDTKDSQDPKVLARRKEIQRYIDVQLREKTKEYR